MDMDVLYYLRKRTHFIWYFFQNSAATFLEIKRKIEAEEAPFDIRLCVESGEPALFDSPPYVESGEPAFLDEWIEADEAVAVLGRSCLTMVSLSLHLYFRTWEKEIGVRWETEELERAFKKGFLRGYRTYFEKVLGQPWADCPADLELVEQIILARNRDQHPEEIMTMHVEHGKKDLAQYPRPVFMSEYDLNLLDDVDLERGYLITPTVHVSSKTLRRAIAETEKLAAWLEEHMLAYLYHKRQK